MTILPKTRKLQTYTISIQIVSRLAIQQKMARDFMHAPPKIIRIMGDRTASIEINFIDYAVQRAFMKVFDGWFKTLPRSKENPIIKVLQRISHNYFVGAARLLTVCFTTGVLIASIPSIVSVDDYNLLRFGKFLLCSFLAIYITIYITRAIASWCARHAEHSIDKWSAISYIKFNKADDISVNEALYRNKKSIVKSLLAFIGTISVAISTKLAANIAVEYFK